MVAEEPWQFTYRQLLVELAAKSRIPAIYSFRDHVELGGLMAYSFDYEDLWRHMAGQVVDIFKGTKPAEIPFYQPSKFALAAPNSGARADIPGPPLWANQQRFPLSVASAFTPPVRQATLCPLSGHACRTLQ